MRAEDDRGNRLLIRPKEVVFCDSKGQGFRSRSESRQMLAVGGGLPFLATVALIDPTVPKTEPIKVEEVDGTSCGVFSLHNLVSDHEPMADAQGLVWIPLKQGEVPVRFLRLQIVINHFLLEVRLIEHKRLPIKSKDFFVGSQCSNVKDVGEDELLELLCEWLASEGPSGK
jgi:hypothetical protein